MLRGQVWWLLLLLISWSVL